MTYYADVMVYGQGAGQSTVQLSYIVHPEGVIRYGDQGSYEYNYFETDHLGSTRVVIAALGSDENYMKVVQQTTDYSPYGLPHELNQLQVNRYLFGGKEYQDADVGSQGSLGWYDFHARYYNPTLGRWFNADPSQQFASPYVYAANSPGMFVDPDGMQSDVYIDYWGGYGSGYYYGGYLFTEGFLSSFLSHTDSISNKREAVVNLPPEVALPHTVKMFIADRLLSSRARLLLTS